MMTTPDILLKQFNDRFRKEGLVPFASAAVVGLLTHLPALVSDIPNHDGLASMYFDQNMITSGRWFLGIACGISSYYSIPWLIGVLAMLYLAVTAVFFCKTLEIKNPLSQVLVSAALVTFPTLASNFAYVFTMDGYMLALLFAVLSVYFVDKGKLGFLAGGVFLAFSLGTYQAYLPIAILLCLYKVLMCAGSKENLNVKDRLKYALRYLYMGVIGVALYYIILKVLLKIEGKELDTYQGISGMAEASGQGIFATVKAMYADFVSFTLKGNILWSNGWALAAQIVLGLTFLTALVVRASKRKWFKSAWFYVLMLLTLLALPVCTNVILAVSAGVNYHLLMRYQWVMFDIMAIAFTDSVLSENSGRENVLKAMSWTMTVASAVIAFSFAITDNIAYSNLQKKYEKTYAYCLRLADRIEQTEGYYEGIPIYMIGVVGDDNYPETDITGSVTGHMIGMNGDYLLYTGENYELFFKYYMGITFNFLDPSEANFYYEDWYVDMPSFPAKDSIKIVDGVLCVKTENSDRTGTE